MYLPWALQALMADLAFPAQPHLGIIVQARRKVDLDVPDLFSMALSAAMGTGFLDDPARSTAVGTRLRHVEKTAVRHDLAASAAG